MDDDETFKPVFLSAISRSGTFIIESAAPENVENRNFSESSTYDQQKETPLVEIKPKPRAQASLENNKEGSADITTATGSSNTVASARNDNVSAGAEVRKGKTGSRDASTESSEKVPLDETTGTKNGGGTELAETFTVPVDGKIVELNGTARNSESTSPEVPTNNSKVELPDVFCESERTPEIEPRRGINEPPDVSTEREWKPKDTILLNKTSIPSTIEQPTVDKGESPSYIPASSTSSGKSSLPSEKLRPTPAPRRSVVKQPDKSADKYILLHKDLCDRWSAVAQVPKLQSIDSKTMAILQEQADRRLMTLNPPCYVEDFRTSVEKVEEALKRFYDQEINYNYQSNEANKVESAGLPTLKFLQWILPSLDKKTQDLLFGGDIMPTRIK